MQHRLVILFFLLAIVGKQSTGQTINADVKRSTSVELPGRGLNQFDFLYAGEAKDRNMYIVRNGKITWSYIDTTGRGEISDAVMMTNGNILFAHQYGVILISQGKEVLWRYDVPGGFEVHTAQPIGLDHVVFVQNGSPAKVYVINIKSNSVVKEFLLPFKSGTHGQMRHARLTAAGTLLVAHMDLGKVCEYDINGNSLLSIDVPSVWSAVPLKNGNILVTSNQRFVKELNRKGETIWEFLLDEVSDYRLTAPQIALRLENGNTLINNWFNQWSDKLTPGNEPVQAVVVTPDKKIVWALRSWTAPANLGPSTTFQLLNDSNSITENVRFGEIK